MRSFCGGGQTTIGMKVVDWVVVVVVVVVGTLLLLLLVTTLMCESKEPSIGESGVASELLPEEEPDDVAKEVLPELMDVLDPFSCVSE